MGAALAARLASACLLILPLPSLATYEQGRPAFLSGDYTAAVEAFRGGAANGDARAEYALGVMHWYGLGTPRNDAAAAKLFAGAAAKDHRLAQYNYSTMLYLGRGVRRDFQSALAWMEKAAESGDAQAQNDAGFLNVFTRGVVHPYRKARGWFVKAAEQGHLFAKFNLAAISLTGSTTINKDEPEAFRWFLEVAGRNHVVAQFNVGLLYEQGRGVEPNAVEAARWYAEAARGDFTAAFNNLAKLYESGAVPVPAGESPLKLRMRASQRGFHWQQSNAILPIYFGARAAEARVDLDRSSTVGHKGEGFFVIAAPEMMVDRDLKAR
jgi:uncharacterized protein